MARRRHRYIPGAHLVKTDCCGRVVHNTQVRRGASETQRGFVVCVDHWDSPNPLNFRQSYPAETSPGWPRNGEIVQSFRVRNADGTWLVSDNLDSVGNNKAQNPHMESVLSGSSTGNWKASGTNNVATRVSDEKYSGGYSVKLERSSSATAFQRLYQDIGTSPSGTGLYTVAGGLDISKGATIYVSGYLKAAGNCIGNSAQCLAYASGPAATVAWADTTAYAVGDRVIGTNSHFYCNVAHTSSTATQPSTGASFATYWRYNNYTIAQEVKSLTGDWQRFSATGSVLYDERTTMQCYMGGNVSTDTTGPGDIVYVDDVFIGNAPETGDESVDPAGLGGVAQAGLING